jgi:hypothetical protein
LLNSRREEDCVRWFNSKFVGLGITAPAGFGKKAKTTIAKIRVMRYLFMLLFIYFVDLVLPT